jgi:hypothetical protein
MWRPHYVDHDYAHYVDHRAPDDLVDHDDDYYAGAHDLVDHDDEYYGGAHDLPAHDDEYYAGAHDLPAHDLPALIPGFRLEGHMRCRSAIPHARRRSFPRGFSRCGLPRPAECRAMEGQHPKLGRSKNVE